MNKTITIESVNYSGKSVNILFKPDNDDITINLGEVTIPHTFDFDLLGLDREVYGFYTILSIVDNCPNILEVKRL